MKLSICIHQFFDTYLPNIKGASPLTIKSYRDLFKQFMPFAAKYHDTDINFLLIDHFSTELVLDFLDHIEAKRNNSARTRNHRLAVLKSFAKMIRFMHPEKKMLMERIIHIPQKRTQRKLIGFLYPEEIHDVLKSVDIRKDQGFRDYTILKLLYESGARASEITNLNLDYFEPNKKNLAILGKGNRFRQIELSPLMIRLLKIYIIAFRKKPKSQYENRLFISKHGRELTRHGIYRLCEKYLRKALPPKRLQNINPVHSFRHSCAVAMLASGNSVADIRNHLGHENIQSSMVYLQLDLNRRKKIQKKFTEHTQALLNHSAEIEELINQKEKEDIMDWLDDL